jgi:hypothetical protein
VTKRELEEIYGVTYKYVPKQWSGGAADSAALALRTKVMGGDNPELWDQMKRLFAAMFTDTIPQLPENVPPRLDDLFTFVACSKRQGLNIFGNGAGKSFMTYLLTLLPTIKGYVRTSTTQTPQTDWCGVCTPQLRGVVDVAVVNDVCLLVGEIKSGQVSPFTQILAGMQAIWRKNMAPGHMVLLSTTGL